MPFAYSVIKERNIENVKTDRIFKLIPSNDILTSGKRTAYNMFQGDKQLHAIQDSGLWYLAYRQKEGDQAGNLPEALKQRWTSFNQLMKFVIPYFMARGIKVQEVIS